MSRRRDTIWLTIILCFLIVAVHAAYRLATLEPPCNPYIMLTPELEQYDAQVRALTDTAVWASVGFIASLSFYVRNKFGLWRGGK